MRQPVSSETLRLKRLAILAILACSGERGANLPGLIAGLKIIPAEEIVGCLDDLQSKKLVRRGTKRHPDGDRSIVCYYIDPDLELAVNV
jgi:hypothetical protein